MRNLELRIPPLLLAFACATLIAIAARVLPWANLPFPAQHGTALLLLAGGLVVMFAGALTFRLHGATLDPRDPGRTQRIVRSGIYRVSRNPMYLGMALALAGLALWWASLAGLALVAGFCAYLTALQIEPEERMLLARFGDEYRDYMAQVRRWL